eukprot:4487142-Amphidinium_carterae.1
MLEQQATVVTVTAVLPTAVAVTAAHQNPTWMLTLTRRRRGASGSPFGRKTATCSSTDKPT